MALVCLAIVHRVRPAWVALPLRQAAAELSVSAERLSRLGSRAIEPFSHALGTLTRKGRPPRIERAEQAQAAELAILQALLGVATQLLALLPRRRGVLRPLLVGAWLRLSTAHPTLSMKRFCQTLALSPRTLRHWLAQPAPPPQSPLPPPPPSPPPPPRPRAPRRPRFGFELVLPDTQHAADTTDLCAFGVPLKLLALQDVGGRDQDLLDAVIVDDHESAQLVASLVQTGFDQLAGAQLLTDQGSPYMAERTLQALRELQIEHAPNKEADPRGKSTVERAFLTVKSIAKPLLSVSNELAQRMPALAQPPLAKAFATLIVAALLRAYQAGARATRRALAARDKLDSQTLAEAARQQRQQARADDDSARLILARLHGAYALPGAQQTFVNRLRRYSPAVLLEAEKRFAAQVHRDDIRDRASYFAAVVRSVADEMRQQHRAQQRQREQQHRLQCQQARYDAQVEHWHAHPLDWLRDALDAFAAQWLPHRGGLLFGGRGVGHAWAAAAVTRIVELHGTCAADLIAALLRDWSNHNLDHLGPQAVHAVLAAARPHLAAVPTPDDQLDCAARFTAAILHSTGPPSRPAPPKPLRT